MTHVMPGAPARPLRTLFATLLATALCTVGLGVLSPATAAETSAAARWDKSTYERQVQRHINKKRTARGLSKLRVVRCADTTADRWSKHLARTDSFYHQDMGVVLERCDANYAGETLVKGAISPRRAVKLWMQSPGHRRILLSKQPRRVGIGSYVDAHGQWVTAANFVKL
jgi:uncharacterized protein YkwD